MQNIIRSNRPHLTDSSINIYTKSLNKLYKDIYNSDTIDIYKFNNTNLMIDYINNLDRSLYTKSNYIKALIALTENPIYKKEILKIIDQINLQNNAKTEDENLLNKDDINNIYKKLEKSFKKIVNKQDAQDYVILSLYLLQQPRRAMDYTEMKIKNIDENNDNYIKDGYFIFNRYKNSNTKGTQKVKINNELKKILKKWININDTEYLLYDKYKNKLNSSSLNYRLNKLISGGINSLRHTYLTDAYKDVKNKINQVQVDMRLMGSSIASMNYYII
jgi:integrase